MESLPTLYEAAQLYAFFSLVTALTVCVINGQLLWLVKPWGLSGSMSYILTTLIVSFLFAPMFFIILLLFGRVYKESIFGSLLQYVEVDDE
jgi:hypothetical protein